MEDINNYFNPEAAAVVYWHLFALLLTWLVGILLSKSSHKDNLFSAPKIFARIDKIILKNGLHFWCAWVLLFVLNYKSPGAGMRGMTTGEGTPMFLWGMASLDTINIACIYVFLKGQHEKIRPSSNYYLLVPPLIGVISTALAGSRSSFYYAVVTVLIYWLAMNIQNVWKLQNLTKAFILGAIVLPITLLSGLFAQVLRPLYWYTKSVDAMDILNTLDYKSVLLVKENLFFGITQLLNRLSALKAQFFILNDWYIHEPWQHYNPILAVKRIINDLVPGNIFEGMLTINQLFDYIYHDTSVFYSSEMWSIEGTLYLYFGHFVAPIVVFLLAFVINHYYPTLEKALFASPTFAAFITLLLLDIITNGTAERIIPVDVVRPLISFVIFIFLYNVLSFILRSLNQVVKRNKGILTKAIE